MGGHDKEIVRLSPHHVVMSQSLDMTLFSIKKWTLTERNTEVPEQGIMMQVVLKRKITKAIITTYLPTILLMMTTYVTTFFKPFFFEAALSVNLTTMLMMTTIFMTSLSELTPTAYAKWIDIWLIFCQLVPFIEVVVLTAKEAYREEEKKEEENKLKPEENIKIVQVCPMSEELNEEGQKVTISKMSSKYRFFVIAGEFSKKSDHILPISLQRDLCCLCWC